MTKETKEQNGIFSAEELQNEEWREIEELEGIFISNLGRMKSTRSGKEHILSPSLVTNGQYLAYPLVINGHQRLFYPHRLAAKYFLPDEWWEGCQIHHIDGCKTNNVVTGKNANLMCVSPAEHHRIHKQMRKQQS